MNAPARRFHPAWILAGGAAAGLVAVALLALLQQRPAQHPTPRPAAEAGPVRDAAIYEAYPRVEGAYRMAAEIPSVLDGLHCYCECAANLGHYSLLTCFQSDHAAGCDICLGEAMLAYQMTRQGASLEAIRKAIDQNWGT